MSDNSYYKNTNSDISNNLTGFIFNNNKHKSVAINIEKNNYLNKINKRIKNKRDKKNNNIENTNIIANKSESKKQDI